MSTRRSALIGRSMPISAQKTRATAEAWSKKGRFKPLPKAFRRDGFEIGGRFVAPAEVYPNAEAWGIDGFTLTDKDVAFVKLRELAT